MKRSSSPEYTLLRSKRKSLSLEISKALDVIIRAPLKFPNKDIQNFFDSHQDWIKKKKEAIVAKQNSKPKFIEGECFYFLGQKYPLIFEKLHCNFKFDNAFIVDSEHQDNARAVLLHWFKQQAQQLLLPRVEAFRKTFTFGQIKVKDVKSYWGLCNKENDLHFNWRAVMAPPETIDYLIIHECAHTIEKNHSKRFWKLVASHCPNYKTHEAWLKQHNDLVFI